MSLQRYPEYKDTGLEWLGAIPKHWEVRRLNTFCSFMPGKAHEPFVSDEGAYACATARFVSTQGNASKRCTLNLSPARPGDILMVMSDLPNGRALARAYFVKEGENIAVNQRVCAISVCEGSPSYYFFQLNRHPHLLSFDDGVEQTHLSNGSFLRLPLVSPPHQEQQAIASFLDCETRKIDDLIAEQKKLLVLLAKKRQATISHAVTKGLNPDVKMKDSGLAWLGKVPEHWQIYKLKYLAKFNGGGTPSRDNPAFWNGLIPWVSPKDMKTELVESAEECITEAGLAGSSTSLIPENRLLIVVRSGILKHTIPVAINTVAVALNQDMKALAFRSPATAKFLFRWIQGLNDALLPSWSKQGATVESLEQAYMAETVVPLPPEVEQVAIATFLDSEIVKLDNLKVESERAITLLKQRRSALIAAAVTGQIDVRGLVPQQEPT